MRFYDLMTRIITNKELLKAKKSIRKANNVSLESHNTRRKRAFSALRLLPNTKLTKNIIQLIFGGDFAGDLAQVM